MKRKPKTCRAIHTNPGVQAAYRKRLDRMVKEMADSYEYWLTAAYRANPPEMAQDALPFNILKKKLKDLGNRWIKRFDDMAVKIAENFAEQGKKATDNSFRAALRDAGWSVEFKMTPQMRDAMAATISENVALIKSIPQQYHLEVEGIVARGFTNGRDLETIVKDLRARYGVTKRRAALIARDQSNKLTATVTQARRLELGITQAVWQHSSGGKEPRKSHVAATGKVFDIAKGCYIDGEYILPGQLINCRCSSRSVLPF